MNTHIVIIGAGPAGEAAARTARNLGPLAEITLVEKAEAGGLCLNRGCIPSKTLLEQIRKKIKSGESINWDEIQQTKNKIIAEIRAGLEASIKRRNINLVRGTARFLTTKSISVESKEGTKEINFDKAIITAGTESVFPPPCDQFRDKLWDSDKMLEISKTPKSIVIIGGGAVGCEFACLLNAAGVKVTIIELQANLIPGEDTLVTATLARSFEANGIKVLTENNVTDMAKEKNGWSLRLAKGEHISSEQVLVCVGRSPQLDNLHLEKAGIVTVKGGLIIDEFLQTTNSDVFAAGDITMATRLAHAAARQGEIAAANALGGKEKYDGDFVPRCLYSWPEVASIGREKWELEEKGVPVKTTRAYFKGSSKAIAAGDTVGFVQIVSDPGSGTILGAQIIGPHATELIHVFAVALKKQMTTRELASVMFAHPTLAESIKEAASK